MRVIFALGLLSGTSIVFAQPPGATDQPTRGRGTTQPAQSVQKKDDCSPSGLFVKQTATGLLALHADSNEFIGALDKAVGVDTGYLTSHPATVIELNDDITILVQFPYQVYRSALINALRKREPIAGVPYPSSVAVDVSPSRIDAPDIVKVIVERDGRTVQPLASTLRPTPMTTRMGAKAVLHAGLVFYSCSTFDPDSTIRVTAIPETGSNIEQELPFVDLLMFSAKRDQMSLTLIGATPDRVQQRIGTPDRIDGQRWAYDVNGGVVSVFFDDTQHVNDVRPRTFDLRDLIKRKP